MASPMTSRPLVRVPDRDPAETEAARLAPGPVARVQNDGEQTTVVEEMNGDEPHHWRVAPDLVAGEARELAAPAAGQGDTAEDRQGLVAAVEGSVETDVTDLPDAVDRANTVWLAQDLLEVHPDVLVDLFGISLLEIWSAVTTAAL